MTDTTLDLARTMAVSALFHSVDPAMIHLAGSFAFRTFGCAIFTFAALWHRKSPVVNGWVRNITLGSLCRRYWKRIDRNKGWLVERLIYSCSLKSYPFEG